ncbi:MAG: hypothetical protein ABIQ12_01920 [Opitutaceae bacterium]
MMLDVQSSLAFRRVRAAALAAAIGLLASSLLHATPSALVVTAVQPSRVADIVVLNGGFDAGLRQGMVCRISRGAVAVAEVLLVETRPAASAALILSVAPKQAIRAGDSAAVKLLKT